MSTQSRGRRVVRGRIFRLEYLEDRRLLATATETFTGPSLSGLISQAFQGKNTAAATIRTMLSALQTQLTNGPLADLNSGTVDGNGFIQEVQSLVTSFNQNVDQQLLPHFTHIDTMLKLQGQQVVANLEALNQQSTAGLIPSTDLATQAGAAINTLTGGPIYSLNTPFSAYVTETQTFETDLGTVTNTLSSTATPTLTLAQVNTTIQAESEAYRATMAAGLQVTHPNISDTVNSAVTTLESTVNTIASSMSSTAQSDIHTAIATFDAEILDTTGLLGPNGPVSRVNSKLGYIPYNLTSKQTATTIDSVSGTATVGGPATLTATLNSASGTGLPDKVIKFTLDGAFAGTAITDSNGVATLTGVPQSDALGTDVGGIVASFAGDSTNLLSQNTGDLVVSQASTTTLTSSPNPSVFGQSVTLTATVAAASPGAGTPTGSVTFMNGTTTLGTGTLSSGTATFSTNSLSVGTQSITADYGGDTNFNTSTSTALSQVVNQAATSLSNVSNSPTITGNTSTMLSATLTNTSASVPVNAGETVSFTITHSGTAVVTGTGTTNSSGVATASVSTTGVSVGDTITASYAGSTDYEAATNATGTVV